MRIIFGADHGGFALKEEVKKWLEKKHKVEDIGADELDPEDDYVDYAAQVGEALSGDEKARGILFCRNGFGMVIAANRFPGVRCGEGFDLAAVKRGRTDDDINCLSVPADYVDEAKVKKMIEAFLATKFSREDKYRRRLWKLEILGDVSGGGGCGCESGDGGGGCGCGSHEHKEKGKGGCC